MSRILRKSYLQGNLAAARALLSSLPAGGTHMLDRMGIESRIREIQDQLAALEGEAGVTGEMVLFFYGAPVKEEHGIDARFSAEVLGAYQDLVSKQVAAHQGPLARSGPTKAEKESRLHITNVVHGSFGFELEELVDAEAPSEPTLLARAIGDVTSLIQAAKESEDAFADIVASTDGRVYDALRAFLSVIRRAGASFRLLSEGVDLAFNSEDLATASDRASAERTEVEDQPIPGIFLGALLDSRRFEHRTENGDVIRGKVGEGVEVRDLLGWADRACIAHMQIVTLTRGSREVRRYVLSRLSEN